MGKFKIHHHINELIQLLGVPEKSNDGTLSTALAEVLEKSRTPYITTKVSLCVVKKLADASPYPEAVFEKHDDLKVKNFREVNSLTYLLSEIQGNEKVKALLRGDGNKKLDTINLKDKSGLSLNDLNSKLELQTMEEKIHREVLSNFSVYRQTSSKKLNVPSNIQPLPSWVRERPYMSWNFVLNPRSDFIHSGPIGVLPLNVQESRLIDDILFCLVGVEGDYISAQKTSNYIHHFLVDDSANISLKQLVEQMVGMFSYYSTVIRFVEDKLHYEQGLVNHALAEVIRLFLKDYYVLVSQLENQHLQGHLTLHKLWFYLQPAIKSLDAIASLAATLAKGNCTGGAVLTLLHNKTHSLIGSGEAQEICFALTQAAARPYFEILEKWIYRGVICDYYSEFLVQDNELIKNEDLSIEYSDAYWEKRYTVRREQIPVFLEKVADTILRTGKYLNVIRQCGKSVECPHAKSLCYMRQESQYLECIEPAYHFASKKLLDLLMEDADLTGRLRSVRHYFLLDQGDFVVQFMDMAEEELQKDINDIMPSRLESLLELSLRTSVLNEDKYKDDVRVELMSFDLLTQVFKIFDTNQQEEYGNNECTFLSGLEAFAFDYEVKWPLSLVINGQALKCYQMLFRHIFYCKHVENLLGKVWTWTKCAKSLSLLEMSCYASAFALRQRMFNFIQNLDYYLTMEVIEPHWNTFREKISQVLNVDEVLVCHQDFLNDCLDDCMVTNPKLLQILNQQMKLCLRFAAFFRDVTRCSADRSQLGNSMLFSIHEQAFLQMGEFPAAHENFQQQIASFEKEFSTGIRDLLKMLANLQHDKRPAKMINMICRLDFNGFYENMKDAKDL